MSLLSLILLIKVKLLKELALKIKEILEELNKPEALFSMPKLTEVIPLTLVIKTLHFRFLEIQISI
jgi:hypothetical protein